MTKDVVNQMFRVPNTPQGRLFIELIKEYKAPCYKVVCKGRTISRAKCKKKKIGKLEIRSRQRYGNYPIGLSDNIGVYMTLGNGRRVGAKTVMQTVMQEDKYYWNLMKANNKLTKIGQIMEDK